MNSMPETLLTGPLMEVMDQLYDFILQALGEYQCCTLIPLRAFYFFLVFAARNTLRNIPLKSLAVIFQAANWH